MSPLLAYGAVLVVMAALSLRSATTRVDGRHVLTLHLLFLCLEIVRLARAADGASVALACFAVGTVVSYVYRDWWLLSRYRAAATAEMVAEGARRLRLDVEASASGYDLRSGSSSGSITVRALPAGRALMRIRTDGAAPKVELLSGLLRKQFEPIVPRLRIRLR